MGLGLFSDNSGTISQSFATGHVDYDGDAAAVGGVAGNNNGEIGAGVFWNRDTADALHGVSEDSPIADANGLTSAQMATAASFVGYDFGSNGVWAMPLGATHPVLRWRTPN